MARIWNRLRNSCEETKGHQLEEPHMKAETFPLFGKYRLGWMIVFILAFALIYGLVIGLTDSIRELDQTWLIFFGIIATTTGWVLGGARQNKVLLFIIGITMGFLGLVFIQSGVYQPLYRAYVQTLQLQIHVWLPQFFRSETGSLFYFLYTSLGNLRSYWMETFQWLRNIVSLQGGFNRLATQLVWGSLVWIVLFMLGWFLRRKKHALIASLPTLILLSIVTGVSRRNTTGLIITLSALLASMVLIEQFKRENRWETHSIDFSEELRFDILTLTVPTVALIMIIASLIPRISFENIRSMFDRDHRAEADRQVNFSEALGLERAHDDDFTRPSRPGMPRSHLIGSGPELSELLVMEIDTGETFVPPQADPLSQLPTYYWIGRAYDIYTGSGWTTDEIIQETIPANQAINSEANPEYYRAILHTIRKPSTGRPSLYFTGVLNAVDQNIIVGWHAVSGEFFAAQLNASEYQVRSFVYEFSEDLFQISTNDLPEIIAETYLQLPPEVPERVHELGLNLTGQRSTPYEKAKAIETYLRQFDYTLDLPNPPEDRDLVDYFLFDLQKGYCDYYASAMVVLARASGLPARLAVGYSTGSYDYTRQVFVVSEANAHAWPEIYLEPIGWVPFEPTASLSTFNWLGNEDLRPPDVPTLPVEEPLPESTQNWLGFLGLVIFLLLILVFAVLWMILFRRNKQIKTTSAQIQHIFDQMQKHLTNLFFPLETEHTPSEFYMAYTQHLQSLSKSAFTQKSANQIIQNMQLIIELYEMGVYSPRKLPAEKIRPAQKRLLNLQIHSWLLKTALLFRSG
jgi:transglutaminase-like putative cysteine protease